MSDKSTVEDRLTKIECEIRGLREYQELLNEKPVVKTLKGISRVMANCTHGETMRLGLSNAIGLIADELEAINNELSGIRR